MWHRLPACGSASLHRLEAYATIRLAQKTNLAKALA